LSASPGSGGYPLGHFFVTPKWVLFCLAHAAETLPRSCCSTFTRAFLCVVVATQCLQVVQRVVVTRKNVVYVCRHFGAALTGVDPDPLAPIPSALQNCSTNAS